MRARLAPAAQSLAGAAVLITVVTVASRILGFGRWAVQADQLGVGGVNAAYAAANLLPNVLFEVAAGGALAGTVIPLLAGPLLRRERETVSAIASALLTWALAVLLPLGILVAVFARQIVGLVADMGDGVDAEVTTFFLAVFAVQIPLYGVSVVLGGVLQAHRRFFWPAVAPMLSSGVVIVAYVVFGNLANGQQGSPAELSGAALGWLAWGTTAGVAAMSLPLLVPVARTGTRLRPTFRLPAGVGRRARHLATAGVGALLAQQLSVLAVFYAATRYGGSTAFNVYTFAQAVYVLPYAILAVPLATSAFPRLASRASAGDQDGFARLSGATSRAVLVVSAVGVAALIAVSGAVEAVFGSFTPGGVQGMGVAIAWAAPGLVGLALIFHLSRILYSIDQGRAAVVGTATGWATVVLISLVLPAVIIEGRTDVTRTLASIGTAHSVGMSVAAVMLLASLRRHVGRGVLRGVPRTALVLLVATAAGATAGLTVCTKVLPSDPTFVVGVLVGMLGAIVAAAVVSAAVLVADRSALSVLRRRSAATGANASTTSGTTGQR